MTRTGDREIGVVSGRLLDNPGGLACMLISNDFRETAVLKKKKKDL